MPHLHAGQGKGSQRRWRTYKPKANMCVRVCHNLGKGTCAQKSSSTRNPKASVHTTA